MISIGVTYATYNWFMLLMIESILLIIYLWLTLATYNLLMICLLMKGYLEKILLRRPENMKAQCYSQQA